MKKIITNTNFKKVSLEEQRAQMQDRFLRGRQIAILIYEYFRVTGAHEAVLDSPDLFSTTSHGDEVLLSPSEVPNDKILESFNMMRTRESDQLQTVLSLHKQESIKIDRCRVIRSWRPW